MIKTSTFSICLLLICLISPASDSKYRTSGWVPQVYKNRGVSPRQTPPQPGNGKIQEFDWQAAQHNYKDSVSPDI